MLRSNHASGTPAAVTTTADAVRAAGERRAGSSDGHANVAPYGWAGSVAASTINAPSPASAGSRSERRRSTAPGRANWAAPSPATK